MEKVVGIDTGGTLTKLVFLNEEKQFEYKIFPSNNLALVKEWIERHDHIEEIGLTGGRKEQLLSVLDTNKPMEYIVEFEATFRGVKYLLEQEGHKVEKSIVANIGTGTSIHYLEENSFTRVGGTGIGGGTLTGLSALLTGIFDFEEITSKAKEGNREETDLFVKDIFEGMEPPISGHLTASNFGKISINRKTDFHIEDLLATIQGLVGEVISTLSIQFAEQKKAEKIVYIGSTLRNNDQLKHVIAHYTILKEHQPVFLNDKGFSGAIGALLNKVERR